MKRENRIRLMGVKTVATSGAGFFASRSASACIRDSAYSMMCCGFGQWRVLCCCWLLVVGDDTSRRRRGQFTSSAFLSGDDSDNDNYIHFYQFMPTTTAMDWEG